MTTPLPQTASNTNPGSQWVPDRLPKPEKKVGAPKLNFEQLLESNTQELIKQIDPNELTVIQQLVIPSYYKNVEATPDLTSSEWDFISKLTGDILYLGALGELPLWRILELVQNNTFTKLTKALRRHNTDLDLKFANRQLSETIFPILLGASEQFISYVQQLDPTKSNIKDISSLADHARALWDPRLFTWRLQIIYWFDCADIVEIDADTIKQSSHAGEIMDGVEHPKYLEQNINLLSQAIWTTPREYIQQLWSNSNSILNHLSFWTKEWWAIPPSMTQLRLKYNTPTDRSTLGAGTNKKFSLTKIANSGNAGIKPLLEIYAQHALQKSWDTPPVFFSPRSKLLASKNIYYRLNQDSDEAKGKNLELLTRLVEQFCTHPDFTPHKDFEDHLVITFLEEYRFKHRNFYEQYIEINFADLYHTAPTLFEKLVATLIDKRSRFHQMWTKITKDSKYKACSQIEQLLIALSSYDDDAKSTLLKPSKVRQLYQIKQLQTNREQEWSKSDTKLFDYMSVSHKTFNVLHENDLTQTQLTKEKIFLYSKIPADVLEWLLDNHQTQNQLLKLSIESQEHGVLTNTGKHLSKASKESIQQLVTLWYTIDELLQDDWKLLKISNWLTNNMFTYLLPSKPSPQKLTEIETSQIWTLEAHQQELLLQLTPETITLHELSQLQSTFSRLKEGATEARLQSSHTYTNLHRLREHAHIIAYANTWNAHWFIPTPTQLDQIATYIKHTNCYQANGNFLTSDTPPKRYGQDARYNLSLVLLYMHISHITENDHKSVHHIISTTSADNLLTVVTHIPECTLETLMPYRPLLDSNASSTTVREFYPPLSQKLRQDSNTTHTRYRCLEWVIGEQDRAALQQLHDLIGEEWIYFYTNQWNRDIETIHNGLLHTHELMALYRTLVTVRQKLTHQQFIDTIIRVVWTRTNWYEQLNTLLKRLAPQGYTNEWKSRWKNYFNWHELRHPSTLQQNTELYQTLSKDFINKNQEIFSAHQSGELYSHFDQIRQIGDLIYLYQMNQTIRELEQLHQEWQMSDQQYNYLRTWLFHPRSNPELFLKMHTNPKEFLSNPDNLADTTIHNTLKPSKLVDAADFLWLTYADVIGAWSSGIYEKISYFQPMSQRYLADEKSGEIRTPTDLKTYFETYDGPEIVTKRGKKIGKFITKFHKPGKPKEYYFSWSDANSAKPGWSLREQFQSMPYEQQLEFLTVFIENNDHFSKSMIPYQACIEAKSNPTNWLYGINCDTFARGNGKRTVHESNPLGSSIGIYPWGKASTQDTLKVSSRLTLNYQTPNQFASNKEKLLSGSPLQDYAQWVPLPTSVQLCTDDVEAKKNYAARRCAQPITTRIYQHYFSTYIQSNPTLPSGVPIDPSHLLCGLRSNDITIYTNTTKNTTLPLRVNSYTDNARTATGIIPLDHQSELPQFSYQDGIHPLHLEHGFFYGELQNYIYNHHKTEKQKSSWPANHPLINQTELNAIHLKNAQDNNPNYTYSYIKDGRLIGYLVAYVAKSPSGQEMIYISEIGIHPNFQGITAWSLKSLHLMQQLLKDIQTNNQNHLPITFRARNSTSLKMLKSIKLLAKRFKLTNSRQVHTGDKFNLGGEWFTTAALVHPDCELSLNEIQNLLINLQD